MLPEKTNISARVEITLYIIHNKYMYYVTGKNQHQRKS